MPLQKWMLSLTGSCVDIILKMFKTRKLYINFNFTGKTTKSCLQEAPALFALWSYEESHIVDGIENSDSMRDGFFCPCYEESKELTLRSATKTWVS